MFLDYILKLTPLHYTVIRDELGAILKQGLEQEIKVSATSIIDMKRKRELNRSFTSEYLNNYENIRIAL